MACAGGGHRGGQGETRMVAQPHYGPGAFGYHRHHQRPPIRGTTFLPRTSAPDHDHIAFMTLGPVFTLTLAPTGLASSSLPPPTPPTAALTVALCSASPAGLLGRQVVSNLPNAVSSLHLRDSPEAEVNGKGGRKQVPGTKSGSSTDGSSLHRDDRASARHVALGASDAAEPAGRAVRWSRSSGAWASGSTTCGTPA